MSIRHIALSLAVLLPSAMLPGPSASAQSMLTGAPPASVTIVGARGMAGDSRLVIAAKSRVLSRTLASGCNFMAAYSAAEDDLTHAYMSDINMSGSMSYDAERINERSPNGDVSDTAMAMAMAMTRPRVAGAMPGGRQAAGGCTNSDRNFAAGRNHIARNDRSLGDAFVAFDARDYAKARSLANIAYDKIGYDEAALMLAKIELYGLGTAQNTNQAVVWLVKVSEARFDPMRDTFAFDPRMAEAMTPRIEATLTLAKIFLRGMGTPKNPVEANKAFAKAAQIGFMPANNTLGMAYLQGYGGEKNARKALAYFKDAAEAGYVPAQYNLAKLYYAGDDGVPQNFTLAGAWFSAAAKAGHAGALFAAGRMYDLGNGVAPDQKKAIVYYKEAALKSHAEAQSALATYFYTGEVVAQDLATARKLFTAAARQGQADAMFNLGIMCAKGEAGPKDMAMAYVWLTLADHSGQASAAAALLQVGTTLNAAEHARADLVLKPKPKA